VLKDPQTDFTFTFTGASEGNAASVFKAGMKMETTAHFWALVTNHKNK
jgi:hypothetical protein